MLGRIARPALAAGAAVAGVTLSAAPFDDVDAVPRKRLRLPAVGFSSAVACEAATAPPAKASLLDDDAAAPSTATATFGDIAPMTTVTGLPLRPPPPPPEPLLAGVPGLANPGDFDDLEYNHSFRVQENDGLSLMLISMVGRAPQAKDEDTGGPPPEKEPLMLQLQYDLNPGGGDAAFVINDTKSPGTQILVTPNQGGQGRMLQVTNNFRPAHGLAIKTEAAFMRGTGFMGGNVQAKHDGPDFHAEATLSQGQQGLTAEASYHQAVDRHVSAGGTVSAQLGRLLPAPDVTGLGWGAFGAWHDGRREAFLLGRYDSQSGRATARYWRQAHKSLALGASVSTTLGGDWASNATVGGKWSLGGSEGGAPATLTAQLGTDLKAGFAWTKQNSAMSQNISNVFFQTTVSGVYDHRNQEHKLGLQIVAQY